MSDNHDYHQFLQELDKGVVGLTTTGQGHFFTTQARKTVSKVFRECLAKALAETCSKEELEREIQSYKCSQCSRFMKTVGHLVYLTNNGPRSVYWDPTHVTDPVFKKAVEGVKAFVEKTRITGVFQGDEVYDRYEQVTNYGGKEFIHYFIRREALVARDFTYNLPIGKVSAWVEDRGRVAALIKFASELDLVTVMSVDHAFKSGDLIHVSGSDQALDQFDRLLASLTTIKNGMAMQGKISTYEVETKLNNLIWGYIVSFPELLTFKNSLIGQLVELASNREGVDDVVKTFWKTKSHGLAYRRSTTEASSDEITKSAAWLEENGYDLSQVVAVESEIPAVWVAPKRYTAQEVGVKGATLLNMAAAKAAKEEPKLVKDLGTLDFGTFFNNALKYVEELAVDLTSTMLNPVYINRMKDVNSKPLLAYDTNHDGIRRPWVSFSYRNPFGCQEVVQNADDILGKYGALLVPVLSMTTAGLLGNVSKDAQDNVVIMLGGLTCPYPASPAWFSDTMLSEFYPHRKVIENFMKFGVLDQHDGGDRAVGMFIHRLERGQSRTPSGYKMRARLSPEGALLYGSREITFVVSFQYIEDPIFGEVIHRNAAVIEEPAVEATANDSSWILPV